MNNPEIEKLHEEFGNDSCHIYENGDLICSFLHHANKTPIIMKIEEDNGRDENGNYYMASDINHPSMWYMIYEINCFEVVKFKNEYSDGDDGYYMIRDGCEEYCIISSLDEYVWQNMAIVPTEKVRMDMLQMLNRSIK